MLKSINQEIINACYKTPPDMPVDYQNCVRFLCFSKQHYRHNKAKEQLGFNKVEINEITNIVNAFLNHEGFVPVLFKYEFLK